MLSMCQKMTKYANILCKIKLYILDQLTMIQTCSLPGYFLDCLEKDMQMHIDPGFTVIN